MESLWAQGGVLLLSGGVDSTALAQLTRPQLCVVVDYGQVPAASEIRAARAVTNALDLPFAQITLDLRALGSGLLHGDGPLEVSPSPEWWPYRNQFLVTAAASIALQTGSQRVVIGSVLGDGERHADGTASFYDLLNRLLLLQEGAVTVEAPALDYSTADLVRAAGLDRTILGWTTSCHRSNFPCHACPGCWKRDSVLQEVGFW